MKAKVTGPRNIGQHLYEVDRSALIAVFVAGVAVGTLLVILLSHHHNRAHP
jgi:hypothetical protein